MADNIRLIIRYFNWDHYKSKSRECFFLISWKLNHFTIYSEIFNYVLKGISKANRFGFKNSIT